MVKSTLEVFVVPTVAAGQPPLPPGPPTTCDLVAKNEDGLLEAARERLAADGYRVRSLCFGPRGLVAYVEVK